MVDKPIANHLIHGLAIGALILPIGVVEHFAVLKAIFLCAGHAFKLVEVFWVARL